MVGICKSHAAFRDLFHSCVTPRVVFKNGWGALLGQSGLEKFFLGCSVAVGCGSGDNFREGGGGGLTPLLLT